MIIDDGVDNGDENGEGVGNDYDNNKYCDDSDNININIV